jgi:hypothetical protein
MKYNRFEDLPVWKAAINLAISTYSVTLGREFRAHRSLRDQI